MILDESMRAKGKDFAWKQRGMNLEICHFKKRFQNKVANFKILSYAKLSVSSRHIRVLGQFQINKKYAPNKLNKNFHVAPQIHHKLKQTQTIHHSPKLTQIFWLR